MNEVSKDWNWIRLFICKYFLRSVVQRPTATTAASSGSKSKGLLQQQQQWQHRQRWQQKLNLKLLSEGDGTGWRWKKKKKTIYLVVKVRRRRRRWCERSIGKSCRRQRRLSPKQQQPMSTISSLARKRSFFTSPTPSSDSSHLYSCIPSTQDSNDSQIHGKSFLVPSYRGCTSWRRFS